MQELLAPNGKPSNLTPEQWKLVRTPEFKAWFGDWDNDPENSSKVVDENGEPLVQYHFTYDKFTIFKNKESGFHFGDKSIEEDLAIVKGGKFNFKMSVFLSIKNPLRIEDRDRFYPINMIDYYFEEGVINSDEYDDLLNEFNESINEEDAVNIQSDVLINLMNKKGYDGFVYENKFDSQDSRISYLIDDDNLDIFIRNDEGVFVGKVIPLEKTYLKPLIVWKSHTDKIYVIEKDEGEILTESNKKRITDIINQGGYFSVFRSPKTYQDVDMFLSEKKFIDSWIAFESNQIKLADGSNTTFDGNNPDIRYEEGGLVSPNGNPSNLTPEQYRLVRTPAFKQWFGDWENLILTKINDSGIDEISLKRLEDGVSKVVDSNGEPLVCYHGTRFGFFTEFDVTKIGGNYGDIPKGFYFTNFKEPNLEKGIYGGYSAKEYAEAFKDWDINVDSHIFQVFLNIKNPHFVDNYGERPAQSIDFDIDEIISFIRKENFKSLKNSSPKIDGIISKSRFQPVQEIISVAFKSNQIKLADGTNTTFDGKNPDIRFEDGGEIIINPTEIECHKCHWHWKVKDGGDDLFICHKCNYDNTKFYEFKGLEGDKILDTISYDKGGEIKIQPIENKLALNYFSRTSNGYGQFIGKNGKLFYIRFDNNDFINPSVKVFDGEKLNDALSNGYAIGWIAIAFFNVDFKNKTFSGYSENHSIQVNEEYRRIGIASAITDFAEEKLGMKYVPSKLLTKEMQGFVNNRFNYKKGGRTIAQTPAPKKDQIKGSDKNKEGSSKDLKSAKEIELSDKTITSIKNKIDMHNEKHPNKKITLDSAKAVVRRGMGAYSSSYRPTISGGKPNRRVAWGLARLNAFLYKIVNGKSKSGKYSQDNDLIEELGYKVQKFSDGGQLENEELNKIKEAYDFGSEYFEGEIYGQEYKIRMNKNHPRNSYRNDDQSIHNLSLVNVQYPSAVVFREKRDKLQYQYDKIYNWDDAKEKIEDFFYEIKDRAEYYSDGGDIQAYEEAMGISEFKEGGEAKPKKIYVSIQLPYDIQKLNEKDYSTISEYFYSYNEKPFEELKNGTLEGLVGVSSSPNNIAEWFIHRDCLIVMDYEQFIAINETETINYYDPYQLMKNKLYLFKRLYANVSRYGEQDNVYQQTLSKIGQKIRTEIILEMNISTGQRYSELYRIDRFLDPHITSAFYRWVDKKQNIESPIDLTNSILEFNKLNDDYLGKGFENPVLTFNELLPIVEKGITNASKIYESEQEVVLKNRELNIPKKSQLFFIGKNELGNDTKSNKLEIIEKYELKDLYKIHFVDRQELEKYRSIWRKKEEEKFKNQLEKGREELELKKEQVLDELLNYFLEKSISYFKNELEKEILEHQESLDYYDETDDDYIEQNLFSIPLVESIMNTYVLIVKNFWKGYIQKKRVEKLDLYAFDMFYFNVESELKRYFENNYDELEKLYNYRNTKGSGSLDPNRFQRLLLKTINDYEYLPELIGYKELAKMYLDKMGRELYRYYDKNDLKLVSQYKDGGEADEPTRFWGTEAGGVLIYCSSTDRYLILLRSEYVLEPNTWGIVSGKLDDNEDDVQQAVYREAEEEIGRKLTNLIPSYIFERPNFKFHNFVSIVNEEFVPQLDWENSDYRWVKLDEMPENLHFGLKLLLQKEELPKIVKKNKMENEILIVEMNMYFNDTSVNFKNKEIPLKLNPPKNQNDFIDWSEENNIEFEQWGDFWNPESELIDTPYGYTFEIPLFKYIEYMKIEKFYTGGELKKGIKTEMEHKDTINKLRTGEYSTKEGAEMIAKDHLKENEKYYSHLQEMERKFDGGGQTPEQKEKIAKVMGEFKRGELNTSYGEKVTDDKQAIAIALSEAGVNRKEDGGKVLSIMSEKGDIMLSLDDNWYSDDSSVELVPVDELLKFREFDRKKEPKYNQDNSTENINHLKFMFQKDGVKAPLIIEYSKEDNVVLLIEGNHRLNSAVDLGMKYLPARVVLKKHGKYSPSKLKHSMNVSGIEADQSGYISSDLKPSQIGISGAIPLEYKEGGIIEGQLHSECDEPHGCGEKFQVGEGGHIIEAERDEAVIVAKTFEDNNEYTIKGTPSQISSALNVMGGGKNFDRGAEIIKSGQIIEIPALKTEVKNTDVDDIIDSGSIIINRRSMADQKEYEVTGTPKQIASAVNSLNGNGVVIEEGATITKT
jgi:8-oxo-dGTP pyrophosphatase MutT (NUDIX family)